jgi:hypothetical protein
MAIGGATAFAILMTTYFHTSRKAVFDTQFTVDDLKPTKTSNGESSKTSESGDGAYNGSTLQEMYDKLDTCGSFDRELNGSLTKEAFM